MQAQKEPAVSFLPRCWDWKVLHLPDSSRAFPQHTPYPLPSSVPRGARSGPKANGARFPSHEERAWPCQQLPPRNLPQEPSSKDSHAPQKQPEGLSLPRGHSAPHGPDCPAPAAQPRLPAPGRVLPRQGHGGDSRDGSPRTRSRGRAGREGAGRAPPPRLRGGAGDARGPQAQPARLPPEGALRASPAARPFPLRQDAGGRAAQDTAGRGQTLTARAAGRSQRFAKLREAATVAAISQGPRGASKGACARPPPQAPLPARLGGRDQLFWEGESHGLSACVLACGVPPKPPPRPATWAS